VTGAGRLAGKVAVVTGAGSSATASGVGIGQAISTVLAREGASVVLVDKDPERGAATLGGLAQLPGRGVVFEGDVRSSANCEAMIATAVEQFGGLDILVNNAAISKHHPITDTPDDVYDEIIGINLTGSFLACKYAIPALIDRGGGSIVNISSVAAVRDTATTHPAYCASKAAQLGLTIDLAGEYGRRNVRVNAVLPGMIASPMQASVGRASEDMQRRLNLLGRMGDAWDIAHAVLFLCSDEASYLTGVILPVDGGATMAMPSSASRADRVL
jgi:NAD(P)-dependent dehydrogenase (short-subunit alcohol dehydrogenase family)